MTVHYAGPAIFLLAWSLMLAIPLFVSPRAGIRHFTIRWLLLLLTSSLAVILLIFGPHHG